MKKVGIVSLYYNSKNYGGLLQAYALVKIIENLGYPCEQISLSTYRNQKRKRKITVNKLVKYLNTRIKKICNNIVYAQVIKEINVRNLKFTQFEKKIPHSKKIYTYQELKENFEGYQVVIAGSDQIWNMSWYKPEYFLDFVPNDVYKFSYAASMPNINLTHSQKEIIKKHLKNFKSISVREKVTVDFLQKLINTQVRCVLDPTLLLKKEEWDGICGKPIVKEKYILCYFLDKNRELKKIVKRIAKEKGLKLVVLPHLSGLIREDISFGDYKLFDIAPDDFISLIKNAEYVFTDSFHATVFSNIYKTKYYVFCRNGEKNMIDRITTVLELFEAKDRLILSDRDIIKKISDEPIRYDENKIEIHRKESIQYLENNLGIAFNKQL